MKSFFFTCCTGSAEHPETSQNHDFRRDLSHEGMERHDGVGP